MHISVESSLQLLLFGEGTAWAVVVNQTVFCKYCIANQKVGEVEKEPASESFVRFSSEDHSHQNYTVPDMDVEELLMNNEPWVDVVHGCGPFARYE